MVKSIGLGNNEIGIITEHYKKLTVMINGLKICKLERNIDGKTLQSNTSVN